MQYSSGYQVRFDAGHRYTVKVWWARSGAIGIDIEDYERVRALIIALALELNDRDLAKMLGPHHPSPFGIASFFMERLAINVPVSRVEVHESGTDIRAAVEPGSGF